MYANHMKKNITRFACLILQNVKKVEKINTKILVYFQWHLLLREYNSSWERKGREILIMCMSHIPFSQKWKSFFSMKMVIWNGKRQLGKLLIHRTVVWWGLWNFIVRQIRFNKLLHPNELPLRIFWYLWREVD